ncbi:hypothetical protein J437_LFUL012797 [Ladona fulva]|uniref:Histone-lysine N-methyltransferase MLL3 n=1 Tax=Ladona fulva TaxID=123851 RepID=A0A8K0P7A4_LADFU|nr:hypothetical protein J437_LFUL012797 [Ladona fulva]
MDPRMRLLIQQRAPGMTISPNQVVQPGGPQYGPPPSPISPSSSTLVMGTAGTVTTVSTRMPSPSSVSPGVSQSRNPLDPYDHLVQQRQISFPQDVPQSPQPLSPQAAMMISQRQQMQQQLQQHQNQLRQVHPEGIQQARLARALTGKPAGSGLQRSPIGPGIGMQIQIGEASSPVMPALPSQPQQVHPQQPQLQTSGLAGPPQASSIPSPMTPSSISPGSAAAALSVAAAAPSADTQEIPESVTAELEKLEQDGGMEVEGVGGILGDIGDDDEELLEMGNDFNILEYADPELDIATGGEKTNILDDENLDLEDDKEEDNKDDGRGVKRELTPARDRSGKLAEVVSDPTPSVASPPLVPQSPQPLQQHQLLQQRQIQQQQLQHQIQQHHPQPHQLTHQQMQQQIQQQMQQQIQGAGQLQGRPPILGSGGTSPAARIVSPDGNASHFQHSPASTPPFPQASSPASVSQQHHQLHMQIGRPGLPGHMQVQQRLQMRLTHGGMVGQGGGLLREGPGPRMVTVGPGGKPQMVPAGTRMIPGIAQGLPQGHPQSLGPPPPPPPPPPPYPGPPPPYPGPCPQEQPLLLEDLLEQEKREQEKQQMQQQQQGEATTSLLSDVDFERLRADVFATTSHPSGGPSGRVSPAPVLSPPPTLPGQGIIPAQNISLGMGGGGNGGANITVGPQPGVGGGPIRMAYPSRPSPQPKILEWQPGLGPVVDPKMVGGMGGSRPPPQGTPFVSGQSPSSSQTEQSQRVIVSMQPTFTAPPLPPEHPVTEQDRQAQAQYEQWLNQQQQAVNSQLKYYETEVNKLRKAKKSLNSKQRQLRKTGQELGEGDAQELERITREQSGLQKQLDHARKQTRQHGILDYHNKQQKRQAMLAMGASNSGSQTHGQMHSQHHSPLGPPQSSASSPLNQSSSQSQSATPTPHSPMTLTSPSPSPMLPMQQPNQSPLHSPMAQSPGAGQIPPSSPHSLQPSPRLGTPLSTGAGDESSPFSPSSGQDNLRSMPSPQQQPSQQMAGRQGLASRQGHPASSPSPGSTYGDHRGSQQQQSPQFSGEQMARYVCF